MSTIIRFKKIEYRKIEYAEIEKDDAREWKEELAREWRLRVKVRGGREKFFKNDVSIEEMGIYLNALLGGNAAEPKLSQSKNWLKAINHELAMKRSCYPKWLNQKRISLEAVEKSYRIFKEMQFYWSKHQSFKTQTLF